MEEKEIICIGCPKGCQMTVKHRGKNIDEVLGYGCKIGLQYAKDEFLTPKRIITTTVKLKSGYLPFAPVKTKEAIPKEKIFEIMNEIQKLEVDSPVKVGDVLFSNLAGTGVDLVCTRNIKKSL